MTKKSLLLATILAIVTPLAANASTGHFDTDGILRYPYGSPTPPTMSCTIVNVCSISLQGGEKVFNRVAGDTVRWTIVTGVAGSGGTIPLIFFKPTDTCDRDAQSGRCNGPLQTNLIITTDRHNYQIILKADSYAKTTQYGFTYPHEDSEASDNSAFGHVHSPQDVAQMAAPTAGPTINELMSHVDCGNYRVVGKTPFTPTSVCNDGIRTYLRLPADAPSPTFQVQHANGDFALPTVHPPVDNVYIMDGVPDHIVIIGDVGRKVPNVDIFHNGAR